MSNKYDSVITECQRNFTKKLCKMTFLELFNQVPVPVSDALEENNLSHIIHSCAFADLFFDKEFLHLPIMYHLNIEGEDVFLLSIVGTAKCEKCNLEHEVYDALFLDCKTGRCYLQPYVYGDPEVERICDTSYKQIKDIVPLLREHTSLFDFHIE